LGRNIAASLKRGASNDVTSLEAGFEHVCALKSDNKSDNVIWCWGRGDSGQLGLISTQQKNPPTQVNGLAGKVSAIAAGGSSTCAVVDEGAWCWGANGVGQLGNDITANSNLPTPVSGLGSGVKMVKVGGSYLRSKSKRQSLLLGQ
jgi:Regulator of chromosome condensation (RCC1) repeat